MNDIFSSDYVLEKHLKHFTGGVNFMTTNICNAKCVCCPYPMHVDPKTTMSLDDFRRYLDNAQAAGHVGSLLFTPMNGDPTVDPTLFDKIAYAKQKGVTFITFSSNGILFNRKDIADKIVDSGVDTVHVSTAGFDPQYYRETFGVDKADELIDGLAKVARLKIERGSRCKTVIEVSVMLNKPPRELLKMRGWQVLMPYFQTRALQIAFHDTVEDMFDHHFPGWRNGEAVPDPDGATSSETGANQRDETVPGIANYVDNWSGTITNDMLPAGWGVREPTHTAQDPPCWRTLSDLSVLPDGKVRVCSCRYMGTANDELVIGDLNEQNLSDIVFGDKHKSLLRQLANGNWPEVCAKCSLYKPVHLSAGERDFYALEATRHAGDALTTHPIDSPESWCLLMTGKAELAGYLLKRGENKHALQQLEGVLSYSGRLMAAGFADEDVVRSYQTAVALITDLKENGITQSPPPAVRASALVDSLAKTPPPAPVSSKKPKHIFSLFRR